MSREVSIIVNELEMEMVKEDSAAHILKIIFAMTFGGFIPVGTLEKQETA